MRTLIPILLCLCLSFSSSCEKAPPTLVTQQGVTAFQNLQVLKAIDLVRDIAQDASHTSPPVLSRDIALQVTNWHTAAVKTLDARGPNWKATIATGLTEVLKNLTSKEQELLRPYVTLVTTVLAAL